MSDKKIIRKRGRPPKSATLLGIELTQKYPDPQDREYYTKRWNDYVADFPDINSSSDANILDNVLDQEILRIKLIKIINDPMSPQNLRDKELMERVEKINTNVPKLLETLRARRSDRESKDEGKSVIDIAASYDIERRKEARRLDELEEKELLDKKFAEQNVIPAPRVGGEEIVEKKQE